MGTNVQQRREHPDIFCDKNLFGAYHAVWESPLKFHIYHKHTYYMIISGMDIAENTVLQYNDQITEFKIIIMV